MLSEERVAARLAEGILLSLWIPYHSTWTPCYMGRLRS